ncbi:MAG: LysM domain-containing protein [Opitutae bacterium]|nr:LysM domain-containing protein [Opitutae bacterium]
MESQNKNLKSIFLNFLLLLALLFSVMGLYISLSFSEKISNQGKGSNEDELIVEVQKLNQSIALLEEKVSDQGTVIEELKKKLAISLKEVDVTLLKSDNKEVLKSIKKTSSATRLHVIQSGDTFSKVAKVYQVSLSALMKANQNLNPRALRVGQEIVIPVIAE